MKTACAQASWKREFADMNGWEAESEAAGMLNGLGITPELARQEDGGAYR